MERENKKYRQVGLFTLISLLIIVFGFQFLSRSGLFDRNKTMYLISEDGTGLTTTSPVMINGIVVGEVNDMNLLGKNILLELSIDKEIEIYETAQFVSVNSGFLGNRQIEIRDSIKRGELYQSLDTIKLNLIAMNSENILESEFLKGLEPEIKELSRKVGKALQEFGESDMEEKEE